MKIIKQYLLLGFRDQRLEPKITLLVHKDAKLVSAKVLHDGIYVWYEVPHKPSSLININEDVQDSREDKFQLFFPDEVIPENYELVDILDVIVEGDTAEEPQKIVLYRIYRLVLNDLTSKLKRKNNGYK